MRNFLVGTGTQENSLFFFANRARPGSQRKIRNFLLRLSTEVILLSFFGKLGTVRFTNLGNASSFVEPHACVVKCKPSRLLQQGKSLFWKTGNSVVWRGLRRVMGCRKMSEDVSRRLKMSWNVWRHFKTASHCVSTRLETEDVLLQIRTL